MSVHVAPDVKFVAAEEVAQVEELADHQADEKKEKSDGRQAQKDSESGYGQDNEHGLVPPPDEGQVSSAGRAQLGRNSPQVMPTLEPALREVKESGLKPAHGSYAPPQAR